MQGDFTYDLTEYFTKECKVKKSQIKVVDNKLKRKDEEGGSGDEDDDDDEEEDNNDKRKKKK